MTTTSRWGTALVVAASLACLLAACSDRYRDPDDPRKNPTPETQETDPR